MTAPSLVFHGLRRGFGGLRVLGGVGASVSGGQLLLVTGANGSGKSTLLRCLAGLLQPEAGVIELTVAGRKLDGEERRRTVGYVAPDLSLYDDLTAEENLAFFCRPRRQPAGAPPTAGAHRLPPDRPRHALSSGMRQRLRWPGRCSPSGGAAARRAVPESRRRCRRARQRLLAEHLRDGLAVVASHRDLAPSSDARLELAR
jgi:ABC-type Fe3+/spermidine/putrescine transport system ATPase subunit